MILFSFVGVFKYLVAHKLLSLAFILGGLWLITKVDLKTGVASSFRVETDQSRNDLMRRNAGAMEKKSGKPVISKKVRNGFWNWGSDEVFNGQRLK